MNVLQHLRDMTAAIAALKMKRSPDYQYVSLEDYVQDRGVVFATHSALSSDEQVILKAARDSWRRGPQDRQCFYNAQMLVLEDSSHKLQYFEGYAQGKACIPVLHGWIVLNGKVIDPTWSADGEHAFAPVWEKIPDGWEYVGVPFESTEVRLCMVSTGMAGTILDDWQNHFPLLKQTRLNPMPALSKVNHG